MVRNLYRTYLYIVCIALLIILSIATAGLLRVVFLQTSLRGPSGQPADRTEVVQAVTFAIVAFIVAGLIGSLHYWLLRRDMKSDPSAGGGGVRAFFLDFSAAISAIVGLVIVANLIVQLGVPTSDNTSALAGALSTAGFYAIVELERRRALATTRAALAFQRLHLFGVPLVAVLFASGFFGGAVDTTVETILAQRDVGPACTNLYYPQNCVRPDIITSEIISHWVAVLLFVAAWLAYVWLARGDGRSAIRQVFHLGGLATALIFALVGAQRVINYVLRQQFGIRDSVYDITLGSYSFIGPLLFGILVFAAYYILYRREGDKLPTGPVVGDLTLRAVTGLIFAVPFFVGCGLVLDHIVQNSIPAGSHPAPEHLAYSLAILIVGLGYPPLAITLARASAASENSGPRRAFVLFLLTGGTITGVVGLVIALRALVTAALGAPIEDWPHVAIDGAVTVVIGGIIVGLYGFLAARERVFALPASQAPDMPLAPAQASTIESVLDELLAGKITRDQAAAQVRQLAGSGR